MIESPKYAKSEIERRWIVNLDQAASLLFPLRTRRIEDKYIHNTRLRLRAIREDGADPTFKLGKKYGRLGLLEEAAVSVYLSEEEYAVLNQLPGTCSAKLRHEVAGGSLDVYLFPKLAIAIFEVEFLSVEAANAYKPPAFAGEEVTGNADFSGFTLANSGD